MTPAPNRKGDKANKPAPSPMAKKKTIEQFTEEQAIKLLEQKDREKREQFLKEYKALCEKHGFEVGVMPLPPVQFVVTPLAPKQG
jgi:oligoendopeptidase F